MGRASAPTRLSGAADPMPTLADWRDLLVVVLRGRWRRLRARLGLIGPERHLTALEADLVVLARLRAVVAPARS